MSRFQILSFVVFLVLCVTAMGVSLIAYDVT